MECNGIRLFVCLFVCFTPVTKQTTNQTPCDMVSLHHAPPPPPLLLPPHQWRPQRWPMTALPPCQCQWTTIKDDCSRLPRNDDQPPKMNTNDGQHTKTAATPKKWTTAHYHHPPQPTNDGQRPRTDTGDADRWRGTRMMMRDQDDDEGPGRWWWGTRDDDDFFSLSFYISYCKYPLPLSSLSTNTTPPLSTTHLVTPPQWEGPPTRQQPRHHAKRNDAGRWRHQRTMHSDRQWQTANNDNRKPMATDVGWQHGRPTSSAQQHHPQTMRSAQHHLHACTSTTTTHQHPPQMAMSNHPWTEPPPSTNGNEGPKPPPPPPSNSTHHEWWQAPTCFCPPCLPFNVHSNNIDYLNTYEFYMFIHTKD